MIDFKKYFPDCEELSSMDDEDDDSDGGPTSLYPDGENIYQLESKRNPTTIKNLELNENVPKEIKKYKTYHLRSVNLNRILSNTNDLDDKERNSYYQDDRTYNLSPNFQATRKLLTSSGSSFGGSTDNSPDGDRYSLKKSIYKELTDFEKDNLLYLDELKERRKNLYKYYEPQVKDLPYYPLGHSKTLSSISGFAEKKITDTVYPRVGSPFPRRKEYPVTAFSPSRATSSKVLRSQSLDEEEEDDILDYWSHSRPSSLFRNFSEPGYGCKSLRYPSHEDTCRLNNMHATDNWWSNRPASLSPVRQTQSPKPMSPHCSPIPNKRTNVPGSLNLKVPIHNSPFSSVPSTPITVPPTNSDLRSSFARESYSRRSHSSPGPGEKLSFTPFNLKMSFNNFQGLQKCRPELEDVGGQFKSILSTSPNDDSHRTFLPITPECITEDTSDEDTSKKHPDSSKYQLSPSTDSKTSPFNSATSTSENSSSERRSDSPRNNDTSSNQNDAPIAATKPTPMAFTVELGDSAASDSSGSGSTGKKLDISASISQWAPKHRRNLSLTKVDEHKKIEERQQNCDKPPLGRPRAGTVGAGSLTARKGGYHSEGYFSSDQDEEGTKRIDLKSPRSPRANESVKSPLSLVRTSSQESPKDNSVRMRPPSPVSSPSSPYAVPLNESASVLIEKMLNATPETKRKFNNKPEGRSCCKERERKPSVSELTGKSYIKAEKDSKMGTDSKNQARNTPTDDVDALRDDKDDVSEAGTYTIDKDSPSPEVDQAREDIDHVFGVPNESEAEMTSTTAVPMSTTCPEDESSWLSASEMAPTISRNSPNWIQQWAAQVAEQTKPVLEPISPHCKTSLQSPRVGHKLALSSQESNDSRPRRKLPTPPSHLSKQSNSPRTVDVSDLENSKNRYWRDSMVSSDLTSDTEAFLRDTENIVTSLQARVNKTKGTNPAFRNSSFESHESGGDSDLDTSTSYPFRDDEKLSASLRSKLRLTGLHQSSKNLPSPSPVACSPRRTDGGTVGDPRILNREATYDLYPTRREECAVQSDSSSETSEPYKDPPPRIVDNNPPLKFNRAFSLRRARLGCDEPAVPLSAEKKKLTRPSSAGAVSSGRTKASLGATKSYQSVDNPSVSSPRNYGFGSPRGIASSSLNVVSKVTSSSSDNFDRTDGGRFSLRLPRSVGPSSIGVLKSPSKTNFHKRDSSTNNSKKNALRSNSTLTSKEVDFQNWKRRKNYDPMKAAAEGRKKQGDRKVKNTPEQPTPISDDRSPSPLGSLLRSASFHGTEGGMGNMRWNKRGNPPNQTLYTSEDDGPYSLEEDIRHNPSPRHGSPLRRSPTSPHQLCQSPARQPSNSVSRARRPSLGPAEEGEAQYQSSSRKISLDETGSEGKRSPMNGAVRGASVGASSSGGGGGGRPKTKMEALDNLVISTIHSLSVKVRTTSESLLQKLKSQYDEEGDRAALLEEVLSHLSESDQSLASGQTRSTSRELAGILRNLKKIEHALGVIDRVIIVGDDDYQDDDDLLDEVPQDWVESDY